MSKDKIYSTIVLILILLSISIVFSLYFKNNKEHYLENYLSHYYKLKNMPTIIPFEFWKPNYISEEEYEFDFDDEVENENDNYYKNKNVIELPVLFNYDESDENLTFCYSLLAEFIFCLSPDNEDSPKCKNLIIEKLNELKRCDIINTNNLKKLNHYKSFDVSIANDDENTDKQEEFKLDKEINLIKDKIEDNGQLSKNNKKILTNKTIKEKIDGNKDCVEYGLTQDEHIICKKYE